MVFFPLYTNRMADVKFIEQLIKDVIMSLDKRFSPNDIIEGADAALDSYEYLIQTYNQTK